MRIVTNLLHAYDAAGNNLIIIVGADEREVSWIGEGMLGSFRWKPRTFYELVSRVLQHWLSMPPLVCPRRQEALASLRRMWSTWVQGESSSMFFS